jgi:hypothetical protein
MAEAQIQEWEDEVTLQWELSEEQQRHLNEALEEVWEEMKLPRLLRERKGSDWPVEIAYCQLRSIFPLQLFLHRWILEFKSRPWDWCLLNLRTSTHNLDPLHLLKQIPRLLWRCIISFLRFRGPSLLASD